jgi:hypothetical protein
MNKHLPSNVENILTKHFPTENITIAQLATVSMGMPWQRSLRLYGVDEDLGLIFLTHVKSRKWSHLSADPCLSICLVSNSNQVQLLGHCKARLLTLNDDPKIFEKYWSMIRDDVKRVYNNKTLANVNTEDELSIPSGPTLALGMISAVPEYWESLILADSYLESVRMKYELQEGGTWNARKVSLIDGY